MLFIACVKARQFWILIKSRNRIELMKRINTFIPYTTFLRPEIGAVPSSIRKTCVSAEEKDCCHDDEENEEIEKVTVPRSNQHRMGS